MYQIISATKWTHLPEGGGWYDQNPAFVDRMYYLLAEKSKVEEEEHKRREAEMKTKSSRGRGSGRIAGRRR